MRVLLTGGAGFIGRHVTRADRRGHEVRVLDSLRPDVHQRPRRPDRTRGRRRPRRRCAGSARCAASTRCATWRPRSASASTSRTCPTTPTPTCTARPSCSPRWPAPACTGWCWPARWSSTAKGCGRCAEQHGAVRPAPRSEAELRAGRFEPPCPRCGRALRADARRRGRAARPAQCLRGQQARAGAFRSRMGARDRRQRRLAALPQRLRPGHAARHAVRRGGGDLPVGAAPRRGAARVRGRRSAPRLRARPRRRGGDRRGRSNAHGDGVRALNVGSGTPRTVGDMAQRAGRRQAARRPRSPASTASATSGTSPPTRPRLRRTFGWAPGVDFAHGVAESCDESGAAAVARRPMWRVVRGAAAPSLCRHRNLWSARRRRPCCSRSRVRASSRVRLLGAALSRSSSSASAPLLQVVALTRRPLDLRRRLSLRCGTRKVQLTASTRTATRRRRRSWRSCATTPVRPAVGVHASDPRRLHRDQPSDRAHDLPAGRASRLRRRSARVLRRRDGGLLLVPDARRARRRSRSVAARAPPAGARAPVWPVALWAWCPVVVSEFGNNAHLDWLAVLLRSSPCAGAGGDGIGAGVLLGAAIATKIYPALVLPALMRRRPWLVPLTARGRRRARVRAAPDGGRQRGDRLPARLPARGGLQLGHRGCCCSARCCRTRSTQWSAVLSSPRPRCGLAAQRPARPGADRHDSHRRRVPRRHTSYGWYAPLLIALR